MRQAVIIPGINTKTFPEILEKIKILKDLTTEFHLDVAAEPFANTTTWNNFNDLKKLPEELKLDLHLMLPLKPPQVLAWNNPNVKRFIFHFEALTNPAGVIRIAKKTRKEIYIAFPPGLEKALIEQYLQFVNGVLVLGVHPGQAGQTLLEETFNQLDWIKERLGNKQQLIVDGGVNEQNLKRILAYKPNFIVLASAIYGQGNARENFLRFTQLINQITASK